MILSMQCHSTQGLLVSPDGSMVCLVPGYCSEDDDDDRAPLSLQTKMSDVVRAMSITGSGLDVKDRIWLKLKIPDAFTGTNLVNWLYRNVHGFSDRKEARKYAAGLLKAGYIRSAVNMQTFSEQRYYHLSPPNGNRLRADLLSPQSTNSFYSNPCFEHSTSRISSPTPSSRNSNSNTLLRAMKNKLNGRCFDTLKPDKLNVL